MCYIPGKDFPLISKRLEVEWKEIELTGPSWASPLKTTRAAHKTAKSNEQKTRHMHPYTATYVEYVLQRAKVIHTYEQQRNTLYI